MSKTSLCISNGPRKCRTTEKSINNRDHIHFSRRSHVTLKNQYCGTHVGGLANPDVAGVPRGIVT